MTSHTQLIEHDALSTLLLPFSSGQLPQPQDALFLRARAGLALQPWRNINLLCEQSYKPDAVALQQQGFVLHTSAVADSKTFSVVLVLPPRQRDEARALLARAVVHAKPYGRVVVCMRNNEGARTIEKDLARLVGRIETFSKHKCRVCWSPPIKDTVDLQLVAQWRALDSIQPILGGQFVSRPGLFAWDRIDPASALLATHLPPHLTGRAADLGAGFGFLSVALLTQCPAINTLDLYEAEARALEVARINLASHAHRTLNFHWHDVTTGLKTRYDHIVCNPPFHTQGSNEQPDVGRRFIAVAAAALQPGGVLWLVANRHLPYETVLHTNFSSVRTLAQQDGFKIIAATKSAV